jgi:hypothetical protein
VRDSVHIAPYDLLTVYAVMTTLNVANEVLIVPVLSLNHTATDVYRVLWAILGKTNKRHRGGRA